MKKLVLITVCLFSMLSMYGREYKNIIFMVADGTSTAGLTLTRWYNYYLDSTRTQLALDPYFCGMVKTHSSNAPIGDSAPTMMQYMTGFLSQTGFLGMCPPPDPNDLLYIDPRSAYRPRMTVMEAARIFKNKAIGLAFTCEFPHATPANTAAHWHKRSEYAVIADQMVHNQIDVVFGGGASLLSTENQKFLAEQNYTVCLNDLTKFRQLQTPSCWALFGETALPNELDRDTLKYPSLAEMTRKAIELLNQHKEGFILMVEGSKIDWAAHRNDAIGMISEIQSFDAAVQEAIRFAQADSNTLVVVVSDHGNSGISIGNSLGDNFYDKLSLYDLMEPLAHARMTAEGLANYLIPLSKDSIPVILKREWGMEISIPEINLIEYARQNYRKNPNGRNKDSYIDQIANVMKQRSYIGFTTRGHTGEAVFLAIYSPDGQHPQGLITAPELNAYLCEASGIHDKLNQLNEEYYCPVTDLFQEKSYKIETIEKAGKFYLVIRNKQHQIRLKAYNNQVEQGKDKMYYTQTPAIYVDKTGKWYVSREIKHFFE